MPMHYVPAIRGKMGIWRYYIGTITFEQVATYVREINDELHHTETLNDMIQRSLSEKNVDAIKNYLLTQDERMFNALVLAVYDGEPEWFSISAHHNSEEFDSFGILQLNGEEKIFPVDGQHRTEGIKKAILDNPALKYETVPAIFISHKKDDEGMQRTRRLFTTLNRRAKPVTLNDFIALDEDDINAIITRDLLENFSLFQNYNVLNSEQKSVPPTEKQAFTSIISFYACNTIIIYKLLLDSGLKKKEYNDFLKIRPSDPKLDEIKNCIFDFWNAFLEETNVIKEYTAIHENAALKYRNREGGNVLFRPIVLEQYINAALAISEKKSLNYYQVFKLLNKVEHNIVKIPWKDVLWNNVSNTIVGRVNKKLLYLLLLYIVDKNLLTNKDLNWLILQYSAAKGSSERDEIMEQLDSVVIE